MVGKQYPAATLLALALGLALAGHSSSEENGEVIANLMQNLLAQAPAHSDGSE